MTPWVWWHLFFVRTRCIHKVSETVCNMVGPELHNVSVLGHFEIYVISQFITEWIGVFIRITVPQSSWSLSSSMAEAALLCHERSLKIVRNFFSIFAHSHSRVTSPIPLPKLYIVIPTGFPWENGKPAFPFPMDTSTLFPPYPPVTRVFTQSHVGSWKTVMFMWPVRPVTAATPFFNESTH